MSLLLVMADHKGFNNRVRVYRQLRRRSDFVRTQLIPAALAEGAPAARTFFDMTQAYFDEDTRSGQLLNALDLSKVDAPTGMHSPYLPTMDELAKPRRHRCKVFGFETLHPRYLQGISDKFFQAIDYDRARQEDGGLGFDFMMIVNFILQLMHIAEDGTGRTGEDMLVLLAARAGRTFSLSQTGYRGALEGPGYPILYRSAAQRILYFEVAENFYKSLGLAVPQLLSFEIDQIIKELPRAGSAERNNRQPWPDGLGPAIETVYNKIADDAGSDKGLFQPGHPYRFFADFLACEVIYFTLCLKAPAKLMPGLKSRYPASVNCSAHNLAFGLGQSYQVIGDSIGGVCDDAVALIEAVKMGWSPRDEQLLAAAVSAIEFEDQEIGRLFRRELSLFLCEDEKRSIAFEVPHGMTGKMLEERIMAGVIKARH